MTILSFGITAAAAVGLIERFIREVDVESVTMKVENSPWVQVTVWVHLRGEFKFGLWRSSGDFFAIDPVGAAGDDPVESLEKHLEAVDA